MTPYYEDEWATIYHGDCREIVPGLSGIDVLIMDPPYGIGWSRSPHKRRGSTAHSGIANDEDTSARDYLLGLLAGLPGAVFGSFYAPFPTSTKQVLVWAKPPDAGVVGSVTGFRRDAEPVFLVGPWPTRAVRWSSVLRSSIPSMGNPHSPAGKTGHPHAKPLDLIETLILAAPSGTVIDPFVGSGTTLVAAKNLGRKAIGIEIEERYCEVAADRLRQGVLDLGAA